MAGPPWAAVEYHYNRDFAWNISLNSKCWKLVFRAFPFMGMFDRGGVSVLARHTSLSLLECYISNSNIIYPCVFFSLSIYDHKVYIFAGVQILAFQY